VGSIAIRVDASTSIGSGHLLRCLTLARQLRASGMDITFICRKSTSDLFDLITEERFSLIFLDEDIVPEEPDLSIIQGRDSILTKEALFSIGKKIDCLVVDHYQLDYQWEDTLKEHVGRLMVIDDLSNRPHSCDLLLDQGYGASADKYHKLTSPHTYLLLGPSYTLLRPEFSKVRNEIPLPSLYDETYRVHLFFGMYDAGNMTIQVVRWILEGFSSLQLRVVVGSDRTDTDVLQEFAHQYPGRLDWRCRPPDLATFMVGCHVAIGAPGMSTWERACLGIPSIYIASSNNQIPILERLKAEGISEYIGHYSAISEASFKERVEYFVSDTDLLLALRNKSMNMIDGKGCERVVLKIMDSLDTL
jgi:UDP-2,4-diacetamido-2,4,6-trideoxy-beta-L-altropyranose hydrolase